MKCSDLLKQLNEYLDGEIDAQTKSELDDHLHWCKDCYVVCDTTKKTIEIYRHNEVYVLPDEIRMKLETAITTKCRAHKAKSSI